MAPSVVVLALLSSLTLAQNLSLGTYWGQNKAHQLYSTDPAFQEYSLADFCANTAYDTVRLAFLRDFFSTGDLPGIEFSTHCFYPANVATPAAAKYPDSGFALLRCPDIEVGIRACQSRGKKVLLAISPLPVLPLNKTVLAALNIWNLFLGGQHQYRPFGSAVLDGIDLVIRNTDQQPWPGFLRSLRTLMNASNVGGARPIISISPRCDLPDANFGPTYNNTLLTLPTDQINELVDHINVFFCSSVSCTYAYPTLFYQAITRWSQYIISHGLTAKFFITVPGFGYGEEPYIDAMTGDFIPIKDILGGDTIYQIRQAGSTPLVGMNLYDGSFDKWHTPCKGPQPLVPLVTLDAATQARITALNQTDNRKYSDLLLSILRNQSVIEGCVYRKNAPGTPDSTTTTTTSIPNANQNNSYTNALDSRVNSVAVLSWNHRLTDAVLSLGLVALVAANL